jgi:hypothetical protein
LSGPAQQRLSCAAAVFGSRSAVLIISKDNKVEGHRSESRRAGRSLGSRRRFKPPLAKAKSAAGMRRTRKYTLARSDETSRQVLEQIGKTTQLMYDSAKATGALAMA